MLHLYWVKEITVFQWVVSLTYLGYKYYYFGIIYKNNLLGMNTTNYLPYLTTHTDPTRQEL